MPAKQKRNQTKPPTLISPQSMGGIHGGDGYTYQHRYIVCHIPLWLADKRFLKLMPEASGDIDIVFIEGRKHIYDHVQVKDHYVTNNEFSEAIIAFVLSNKTTGKTYRKYILTCPSVSGDVKSLYNKIIRYREFKNNMFTSNVGKPLRTTKTALLDLLTKFKLQKHFDFIIEKVSVEINTFDLHDNTTCKRLFVASLNEHPAFKKKIAGILSPAYSRLITEILAHSGKVLAKKQIYSFISDSIDGRKLSLSGTVFHIHNWSLERFESKAKIMIDWTPHFDRSSRRVPDHLFWDTILIPELRKARSDLVRKSSNRHIVLRGKCALSTSIAFGNIFPEIGDWTIELMQPPQNEPWRSDADKIEDYKLQYKEIATGEKIRGGKREIAVVFNITGKAIPDVKDYLGKNSVRPYKIISIEPPNAPGNLSIQNDSEAVSLASAAKDIIKQMIVKFKVKRIHLFYFGPAGLAVFLGQKLTSVGELQLYEFQDPGYKPSCLLKS